LIQKHPEALPFIDGVAVHYYADMIIPASVLSLITNTHPDKFILATEACEGKTRFLLKNSKSLEGLIGKKLQNALGSI
jgi:hypothetical protein